MGVPSRARGAAARVGDHPEAARHRDRGARDAHGMAGAAGEHESLRRERAAVRRENSWRVVEVLDGGMGVGAHLRDGQRGQQKQQGEQRVHLFQGMASSDLVLELGDPRPVGHPAKQEN